MAGDPRPSRQPQAGAAPDAAVGTGGDLPAPEYEQAGSGTQDLSVPAARARDRAGQSGLVLRHHLHPDGQGLSLPGGDHGLGQPCGAGLAPLQHARRRFLRRGTRGSALVLLPTGCASPASRASSEGGEMLTFAHIPTGTTVNKAMHIDDSKSRGVAPAAAPTMIGADIETGGATP